MSRLLSMKQERIRQNTKSDSKRRDLHKLRPPPHRGNDECITITNGRTTAAQTAENTNKKTKATQTKRTISKAAKTTLGKTHRNRVQ